MKLKRFMCTIIVIALLITQFAFSVVADEPEHKYYSDVSSADYYYDATNYLYDHDILKGYTLPTSTTLGIFRPNVIINRGQMAIAFWRMLNKPQPSGTSMTFSDVSQGAYYYDAIAWASSSNVGIVQGYENGLFKPNDPITNQTACIMLYRFACHCGYSSNSSSEQQQYINILNNSTLVNRNDFSNPSKAAAGWAYSHGFLSNSVVPSAQASRGAVADYIYHFYIEFQNKYGLAVVNTDNMSYVAACGTGMKNLFKHYGATSASAKQDLSSSQFHNEMTNAFSSAKGLDICYLYIASHGGTSGLGLFTNGVLSPTTLRGEIDRFNGTFVVFISGCHSGTYISEENGSSQEIEDVFDATAFMNGIYDSSLDLDYSEDLRDSKRIKVLCSSRESELSYSTDRFATNYWCMGAGYNYRSNQFTTLYADENSDGRISLNELYEYSHDQILTNLTSHIQTVVCHPNNDSFIIFESSY